MSIPVNIIGTEPVSGNTIVGNMVVKQQHSGQVVFTAPLHDRVLASKAALNPLFGASVNQNGGFSGTPEVVHNGTDTVGWAGTEIIGNKVTFDSTDRFFAGTKSVLVDNPGVGNVWQFDKGSTIDLNNYTAVTFKINVDSDWDSENVTIYGYDTAGVLVVGNTVNIENYFNETQFDTWHSVIIPLGDLGLSAETTVDAFRMEMAAANGGKNPKFYIDSFQVEQTGTPIIFTIKPSSGTIYNIDRLTIGMADALDISLANASVPGLSHDKLLALTQLVNGVTFRFIQNGSISFQFTIRDLGDMFSAGAVLTNAVCDGVNTYINVVQDNVDTPVVMHGIRGDRFEIVVADDLTGLDKFIVIASGSEVKDHRVLKHVDED